MIGKPQTFLQSLIRQYRLSVSDKTNYKDIYSTSVSRLKLYAAIFLIFIVSAAVVVAILFYTPAKHSVPGYPTNQLRELMLYNSLMVDSLENELAKRDKYLAQIKTLIKGEVIEESIGIPESKEVGEMEPMNDDSMFNELIGPDKYKFSFTSDNKDLYEITRLNFFTPIKGVVINKFDAMHRHYGTDIVGEENSSISSVLDGTIVFAEWSVSTGYVVQIQHENNLISLYKHNSDILVRPGEKIKAGGLIAIMGDGGELSTGPHLHFELWQNGIPLNPEQYISF
ncbi:MAG: M23 family metallopeptidase [Prolixibacteraceae bacterium]|jgi:murein DD-endopeptidase MepM/ murein hydrolase activator NlpD|nr:M23 family metallopeptidase [Prolixibacteraceae bacterium]